MKPIISLVDVHDASLCVYDIENDNMIIVDLEKVCRKKHFAFVRERHIKEYQSAIVRRALNHLEIQYGIKNDFSYFIWKPKNGSKLDCTVVKAENYIDASHPARHTHHHKNHAMSSYGQSPFKKAFVISWDGIGDDCSFYTCKINNSEETDVKKWVWDFSRTYNFIGRKLYLLKDTGNWMDIAGKLMGLSAYGSPRKETDEIILQLQKAARFKLSKEELDNESDELKSSRSEQYSDLYNPSGNAGKLGDSTKHIHRYLDGVFPQGDNSITDLDDQFHFAYCAQKMIENSIIELITEKFYDDIKACDNNLILTGGVALNVVANQLVRKTFPEFDVFVSSSSSDSGQSFGLMYSFLQDKKLIPPTKKFDTSYGGMPVYDGWLFERLLCFYPSIKKTTVDEVAELIDHGKVIGVIQDNHEIGPRALGNRSIICDPSFPEMKDHLNSNVKFREWYRPFAPICRKENAPKYFHSPTFEGYELMNYVADIKPEYADVFPSVVHVDGTCRLQTIEESKNKFIYDLLGKTESEVLMNTSLNIKGQPILNYLSDACSMIKDTGLDCIVFKYKEEFYLFDDMALSESSF